jgi:hypothetical protein
MIPTDVNPMDMKIHKSTVKSTLSKKAKIKFGIEFDTMITCTETPKL